jgi:Helix-turn-helix domain
MKNDYHPGRPNVPHPGTIYLRESELALRWRTSERTLQRWRQAGKAPRHLRLERRILYPLADVEAYEAGLFSEGPVQR